MSDRKPLKSLKRRIPSTLKSPDKKLFLYVCPSDGKDAEENVRKKSLLPVLQITLHIFIFFMDAIS
jgi:hypothetical protein